MIAVLLYQKLPQAMNINFEPFRIVNSYGAFGSITKVRHEVVVQGTNATALTPSTQWYDFEFPCKPGDINRMPCLISPYHLRMDWLMWFAAFQNYQVCIVLGDCLSIDFECSIAPGLCTSVINYFAARTK